MLDEDKGEETLGRALFEIIRESQLGKQESTMTTEELVDEY